MNNSIKYTQGDNVAITLTCPDVDLTGATITVKFKNSDDDGDDIEVSGTPDADQTTNKGKFTATPTSDQSAQFALGTEQNILAEVVQSGTTFTFRGNKVLAVYKSTLR